MCGEIFDALGRSGDLVLVLNIFPAYSGQVY